MPAAVRKAKVGVLISGRGSNMMSLVAATQAPSFPAEIVVVISNRPDAAGLSFASQHGIANLVVDHKGFDSREAFEVDLQARLVDHGVEIVCLAGFMRLLTASFVDKWEGRMLNIHPSLLPSFRGLDTHQQAIDAGVKIAGCTVHFVVPEMDAGPIIAQAAVPVEDGDTADDLAARILQSEHKIYPRALELVAMGQARINGKKVVLQPSVNQADRLYSPPLCKPD